MDIDINLHKENVSFSDIEQMVTWLLAHGYNIPSMNVRVE